MRLLSSLSRPCRTLVLACSVFLFLCLGSACRKEKETVNETHTPNHTPPLASHSNPQPVLTPPSEALSQKVEALTGAHTRVVWSQHLGSGTPDTFSNGASHQLHGLDTRDGAGLRVLIAKKGNYSRPLITPDGASILFTRKKVTRPKEGDATKIFEMTICITDWQGSPPRELAAGYALDIWRDPANGKQWVYAAQDVPPTYRTSWAANRLIRFPLDEPSRIETVWDQTQVSPDNTQLSADGTRASGQTPWPHGGQYLFGATGNQFAPTITGCWSSMAPDNSYLSWMLDGSHSKVTLSTLAPKKKSWPLKFSSLPGLEKGEIYHPRWTNHAQFITLTGPYIAEQNDESGSIISKGGRTAEVIIAKLNPTATGFAGSVTLTQNDTTDTYPDVWIAGGETAVLSEFPQGLALEQSQAAWPSQPGHLIFLWDALGQANQVRQPNGKNLECHVEPQGTALFGPHLDMQLSSGSFSPNALAQTQLTRALEEAATWTLQATLDTPSLAVPASPTAMTGPLIHLPHWQLDLTAGILSLNGTAFTHPPLTLPCSLALRAQGNEITVFINGQTIATQNIAKLPDALTTHFGGKPLPAALRGIAVHTAALSQADLQASAEHWQTVLSRNAESKPPRVRLRAKLTEITGSPTAEGIDPYTRAMVAYVYDVEQVLEGAYSEKQILVCHWALMDRQPCAGFPRKVGESFELVVEPLDLEQHHPELEGQRVLDDTTAFELEKWYDVSLPQL